MIIVGARGFAKELLEILDENGQLSNLSFFDDVNPSSPKLLFDKFPILTELDEASNHLINIDSRFALGLGNPSLRAMMYEKFFNLGGIFTSVISNKATIGKYDTFLSEGCNVLSGAVISSSVNLGKGCLVYYNAVIAHDCVINDFVEVSPGAKVLGRVKVGSFSQIGSNATILPDILVGNNVVIGAGAVVNKDVPDNWVVAGVPAVKLKEISPK